MFPHELQTMGLSYGHSESYKIVDILTSLTLINFSSADLINQFSRKLKATNPKTCADAIHDTDTYLVYPPSHPTIRCAMCDVRTPRLTYVYLSGSTPETAIQAHDQD